MNICDTIVTVNPRQRAQGPDTESLGICPPPFARNFREILGPKSDQDPVLITNFKQKKKIEFDFKPLYSNYFSILPIK